ncbi:hypothetical protein GLOTRDRAFT_100723 [Gloeophyllum trabeum ATCC 11539]|uniref:Cupin type-2 domain-containing protein n=1 Tax=Gloeophyllum trabeum (strain ATCC 11539 / FP-39264 / Madison 617) TaxID=670483 RepID=S7Q2G6_GLOTA|nr:uncharacterized protein GLOTRDRAFT_100723 [Gloeophyllum trabeum ATCC 11539]EPQ53742.1 hypothetical protein GLOTRDRAFT_100723 [Gloeophyllum trabeum ATCC 11539]
MLTTKQPYIVRTNDTPTQRGGHPFDPEVHREQIRLGDITGLTKTAVHLVHLPPHKESTVLHWHANDDEWVYVISAGEGAVMRIKEGDAETKDVPINGGDFFAFPAGLRRSHSMNAGAGEVVYLMGGSREKMDVCYYSEKKITAIVDRTVPEGLNFWAVKEDDILR